MKNEIGALSREVSGLLREKPVLFLENLRKGGVADLGIGEEEIEGLIVERAEARKRKDFARADEIRKGLDAKGILLENGPKGTTWKVKETP